MLADSVVWVSEMVQEAFLFMDIHEQGWQGDPALCLQVV